MLYLNLELDFVYCQISENNGLRGQVPSEFGDLQSSEVLWLSKFNTVKYMMSQIWSVFACLCWSFALLCIVFCIVFCIVLIGNWICVRMHLFDLRIDLVLRFEALILRLYIRFPYKYRGKHFRRFPCCPTWRKRKTFQAPPWLFAHSRFCQVGVTKWESGLRH